MKKDNRMPPLTEMKRKAFNNNVSQIKIEIVPSISGGFYINQKILDQFIEAVDQDAKSILKLDAIDIFGKVYKV